ncbi:exodeoxyribonuclease VII small subunit [Tepidiforma sp.]|uniref:exodeoxyribonuclease VII small subunit n=1 Tax=Tepidiforma sp. TaxID=2682230 RepID=UPI002ADE42E4|nr:exodeoxyribonuclease VII small subunit [Tepidiforma sp.]
MADEPTFEALYAELEARARRLEQGNLSLEDSLRLYEEGAALVERLRDLLERAELRVRTVQERLHAEAPELEEAAEPYDDGEFEDG